MRGHRAAAKRGGVGFPGSTTKEPQGKATKAMGHGP